MPCTLDHGDFAQRRRRDFDCSRLDSDLGRAADPSGTQSYDGILGVSIHNDSGPDIGSYRYLLFNMDIVYPNGNATFYGQVDVANRQNPRRWLCWLPA